MNDWLAIVNPHSGGAARRGFRGTVDRLHRETRKVVLTEYPGHATELALGARDYDGLAVAGGDGTIFEVLQGMDRQKQTLAIIPMGRGNSLARDLNLYPQPEAALPDWKTAARIDLVEITFENCRGVCQTVVSASTTAFGYPAEVAKVAGRDFRRFGRLCYAMAAVCVVPTFRPIQVTYASQSVLEKHVTGFLASNTRHVANFVAFPDARPDDGFFEVMELASGFARQSVHTLSSLSRLQFYSPPARRNLTSALVTWGQPEPLLIDGEIYADIVSLEMRIVGAAVACTTAWVPRDR
jgi:diacylglycerol kinase family enzyme